MEYKSEANENKIIPGAFNCTTDKMKRYDGNKTPRLYRSVSKYVLSNIIVDNGLEDLWRRKNTDSSEFTHYNRFCGKTFRITDRVYTDMKIANITKNNHIMISFIDHDNAIFLE